MCHVNLWGPPVVGPQLDLPGPVTGPHAEPTALFARLTMSCLALLSSTQKPCCFPCRCLSISSWLWISCHGSWLWLRTKINPLSLKISSFRPVSVTLLCFLRPVSFREVLAFHERIFAGLHGVPVPLCNWLGIFMPLVITSRLSSAEAAAAAPLGALPGHSYPSLPACGMGGQCYLDGRAGAMYPDGSLTQLPLSTDRLCFLSLLMQTARVAQGANCLSEIKKYTEQASTGWK